jgi:hypothetical protein
MGPGTRLAIKATGDVLSREEIEELSVMNAQSGSARAFARTVRDIIDWRGQRQTFFERANELAQLPGVAVFWGDRDAIIPASHARALDDCLEGCSVTLFKGCGHYPHHERPAAFVNALRDFLDDPTAPKARLRDPRPEEPALKLVPSFFANARARPLWRKQAQQHATASLNQSVIALVPQFRGRLQQISPARAAKRAASG